MPNFEVVEQRTSEMSMVASGTDKITCTADRTYAVETSGADAHTVKELDVLNADGIPKCNRTMFDNEEDDSVVPFILCRSVRARRDPNRLSRWIVSARFKGIYEGSNPTFVGKPANVEDFTPNETPRLVEAERVLYEDKATTTIESKQYISPAGTWYDEPLIERVPLLQLTIEQYETSLTYEEMLERKLKVNKSVYRTKYPYTWLIEDVQRAVVEVELQSGPVEAALATYVLLHNPRTRLDNSGNQIPVGWLEDRTLIDTHFIEMIAGKRVRKEFKDSEMSTMGLGQINSDGTRRAESFDPQLPKSVMFRPQDQIDFAPFLQV